MHFRASTLAFAAALHTVVSASPRGYHEPQPYSTKTQCYTAMGSKYSKHGVLTSYTTAYTSCTSTVTSTTTTTTTLVPVTGTVTVTSTSTVSTISTSTVPAPDGFIPIQTSLPEGTYSGAGGGSPVNKRALLDVDVDVASYNNGPGVYGAPKYPKKVTCKKWMPHKPCTTTTTTVTSTSTVTPGPSFSTTTTTTTTTVYTDSTTVYAACATNNFIDGIVGQAAGQGIVNVIPDTNNGAYAAIDTAAVDSAYDCCVFGLMDPNAGLVFAYSGGFCAVGLMGGQCPATGQATNSQAAIEGSAYYTIGNLPCGIVDSFR